MPDDTTTAPYDGEVKNNTINVHYHPKDDVHWKLALSTGNDQPVSEPGLNELDLAPNTEHRLLVVNVDKDNAHEFVLTLEFQPAPSDEPEARLHSRGLTPNIEDNTLIYTFTLPKKPTGQPAAVQEFSYLPLSPDVLAVTATGDDPRFKIKLKT